MEAGLVARLRERAHWGVAALVVALLWGALVAEIRSQPPAHVDEPRWIASGHLTWQLVTGLAGPGRWEKAWDEHALGNWGNLSPPIGKLVIGAALAPFVRPGEPLDFHWDLDLDAAGNAAAGNLPPQRLLVPARIAVSLCGAASLFLVYVAALQVTGARWLSLVAPLALFASVPFRFHAARVYTDLPQIALMLAGLVAFGRWLAAGERRAFFGALVALGLATAVKLSSAPLVPAAALAAALRESSPVRRLRAAALAGLVPFAVFCAVNPYLWPDPVGRSLGIQATWSEVYAGLQQDPRLAGRAVGSRGEALALLGQRTLAAPWLHHDALVGLGRAAPLLLLASALALVAALRRRRLALPAPASDPRLASLLALCVAIAAARLGLGIGLAPAFAALGLHALVLGSIAAPGARRAERAWWLLACAATFAATALWLPFDWPRYYLRGVTLVSVVWAAGAAQLAGAVGFEPREAAAPGLVTAGR